jgi:hypothetical protein
LPNNGIQVLFVYRFENDIKRHKKENGHNGNNENYPPVNRRSDFDVVLYYGFPSRAFIFIPEKHVVFGFLQITKKLAG